MPWYYDGNAARELVQRTIGCLPVVDHGILVGIVTDMDCLRAFLHTTDRTESREGQPWTSIPKGH